MVTKKGAPMGYVTIEDFEGETEVVVFPSVWERDRFLLKNDAAVIIRGRVQANERNTHLLAERIMSLENNHSVVEQPVLHIYLDKEHESREISNQLAVLLKIYHGNIPVILHIESAKKQIKMDKQFHIDGSIEVQNELKKLLGDIAIEFINL